MLMAGFERAKYEEGKKDERESARANLIDFCRRIGYSDEKINEELARMVTIYSKKSNLQG